MEEVDINGDWARIKFESAEGNENLTSFQVFRTEQKCARATFSLTGGIEICILQQRKRSSEREI